MSMFNFGYNRRSSGLFSQLDDPANIAAIAQRRVPTAMPQDDEEERRRRGSGLLSNLGMRVFGGDNRFFGRQDDGTSFRDRMMMAGMALQGDGRGAVAYRQGLQEQQQAQLQAQAEAERQRLERERIVEQGRALGLQGEELSRFFLAPEEVRNEFYNSRMNPSQPDLPSSVREYEYARQQGFQGSFQDWQALNPRGTSVSVSSGPQGPQIGSIPQGYELTSVDTDGDGQPNSFRLNPIEGGPVDEANQRRDEQRSRYGDIVLDDIERVSERIASGGIFDVGRFSRVGLIDPESPASEIAGLYDTIRANVAFDRLQAMREASPTGGAVGQLSDPERQAFERTLGELEQSRDREMQLYNLGRLQNLYRDAIYGTPEQIRAAVQSGALPESALQYAEREAPESFVRRMLEGRDEDDQRGPIVIDY